MVSKRVQVEIAGMTFHVIGEDDAHYVKDLADEANQRIDEVEKNNYRLNDVQLYILSLLNALDDMHKLEKSDREASALAGDADALKEKIQEMDALKRSLEAKERELEKTRGRLEEREKELASSSDENRQLEKRLAELKEREGAGEEALKERDAKIRELEERNYETQMRLVDLNKEIYLLRGDNEEK